MALAALQKQMTRLAPGQQPRDPKDYPELRARPNFVPQHQTPNEFFAFPSNNRLDVGKLKEVADAQRWHLRKGCWSTGQPEPDARKHELPVAEPPPPRSLPPNPHTRRRGTFTQPPCPQRT